MSTQEPLPPERVPAERVIDRERRLKWFREARFGMFIHWGLYAQLGRHEWVMNRERILTSEWKRAGQANWSPSGQTRAAIGII